MISVPPLAETHYVLFLEDFRRDVRLGILSHEAVPQPVRFDIAAIVRRMGQGDGIKDVIDYRHLRDAVLAAISHGQIGLQETLCETVIDDLMRHDGIDGVIIETRKPEAFAEAMAVGCRMERITPAARAG